MLVTSRQYLANILTRIYTYRRAPTLPMHYPTMLCRLAGFGFHPKPQRFCMGPLLIRVNSAAGERKKKKKKLENWKIKKNREIAATKRCVENFFHINSLKVLDHCMEQQLDHHSIHKLSFATANLPLCIRFSEGRCFCRD